MKGAIIHAVLDRCLPRDAVVLQVLEQSAQHSGLTTLEM